MIVALKQQSRVYLASDSIHSDVGGVHYNAEKIWRNQINEVIMGGEGDHHAITHIQHNVPFNPEVPDKQKCAIYLHSIKNLLGDDGFGGYRFTLFICGSSKIFKVRSDGMILEAEQFEAIGDSREVAMAVLGVTLNLMPEERLRLAISEAMKYNTSIGGNVQIQMV